MQKNAFSAQKICKTAILIALTVVLSYLSGYLRIGNISKISLSFITVCMAGAAFGPVTGGFVGGASDFISWVVNPTGPWLFYVTLIEAFYGVLFGLLFYKTGDKLSFIKTVTFVLIKTATDLFLKTIVLMNAGFLPSDYIVSMGMRIPSIIVMAILQSAFFLFMNKYFSKLIKILRG